MNEVYELSSIKGTFFSPITMIISIGLLGMGISLSKYIVSKYGVNRLMLR